MSQQFTHSQFINLLKTASRQDILSMQPEQLPDGIEMDVLFEAPMEISEELRVLITKAQSFQKENQDAQFLATTGKDGQKILAIANTPSPSPLQLNFRKLLSSVHELEKKFAIAPDPMLEKVLGKLKTQFQQSCQLLLQWQGQTHTYIGTIEGILNDPKQINLHKKAQKIHESLNKHLNSVQEDINLIQQDKLEKTQEQIKNLFTPLQTLYSQAQKINTIIIDASKGKKQKISDSIKPLLSEQFAQLKRFPTQQLLHTCDALLSPILNATALTPDHTLKINTMMQLVQWYCLSNQATLELMCQLPQDKPLKEHISEQVGLQIKVLNHFQALIKPFKSWHLMAIQAKIDAIQVFLMAQQNQSKKALKT